MTQNKKFHLKYSEFYITNVCNQNCKNCNRYNNYAFQGHYLWEDHKEDYIKWSKIVDFDQVGILGGEPLTNPDFLNWLHGIAELWPNTNITIVTNGTQFDRWPTLYEELKQYKNRIMIEISHHTPRTWHDTTQKTSSLLPNISNTKQGTIPGSNMQRFSYNDTSGVKIELSQAWSFGPTSLIRNELTNELSLYDNDPEEAVAVCEFNQFGCHHFIAGKLYKCGPVGLLPEFMQQYKVNVTEKQQQLIDGYVPAQSDWSDEELTGFINNLTDKKSIPQCSLCPSHVDNISFSASSKKIKIETV
jgi:organic radical activating enzyme|tara:strand:+ start:169 stop:1074 length:906 start_codon:yes stop_codon:yes gene_type:complete